MQSNTYMCVYIYYIHFKYEHPNTKKAEAIGFHKTTDTVLQLWCCRFAPSPYEGPSHQSPRKGLPPCTLP